MNKALETYKNEVLSKDFNSSFILCKKKRDETSNSVFIKVKTKLEIQVFISILKNNAKVYQPDFLEDDDILTWLKGKSTEDILGEKTITRKEILAVSNVLSKIGIPKNICEKLLSEEYDALVNKKMVHKVNDANVMLSKYYQLEGTDLLFSRVIFDTEEIILDHVSDDHIQSMVLSEVCRQATVLSSSVRQTSDLRFIVSQDVRNYKNFVVENEPCFIQMMTITPRKVGVGISLFNVIQQGKSCVDGYLVGYSYLREE